MRARSAVLDLYGDHLQPLAGDEPAWAPVSGLVDVLGSLGIAPPAVRTAVSRLVREGWLDRATRGGQRGYVVTSSLAHRVTTTHDRVYADPHARWDGRWHLLVTERVADRSARSRVEAGLRFLGYARLAGETWVAPRPSSEVTVVLRAEDVGHTAWLGTPTDVDGEPVDPARLAAELWDLDAVAEAHREFTLRLEGTPSPEALSPEAAFAARTRLVHAWRKFLFTDPGLPPALLPSDWPGHTSAARFRATADALLPAAREHVARALAA